MKRYIAALVLWSCWSTISAAGPTIYGFEFGKPIALPDCPVDESISKILGRKDYKTIPNAHCAKDVRTFPTEPLPVVEIHWPQDKGPAGMSWNRAFASVMDGGLVGFKFFTMGVRNQDLMLSRLTEKFGKPTTLTTERVQNIGGAAFDSITATWRGADLDVTFYGTVDKLDNGEVYIDTPQVTKLRTEHLRSRAGPKM